MRGVGDGEEELAVNVQEKVTRSPKVEVGAVYEKTGNSLHLEGCEFWKGSKLPTWQLTKVFRR